MPKTYFKINGNDDRELTSIGLWFALTYLYSKHIDPSEQRYKKVKNWKTRENIIKNCSRDQIKSWVYYTPFPDKNYKNIGEVSRVEQRAFAKALKKYY